MPDGTDPLRSHKTEKSPSNIFFSRPLQRHPLSFLLLRFFANTTFTSILPIPLIPLSNLYEPTRLSNILTISPPANFVLLIHKNISSIYLQFGSLKSSVTLSLFSKQGKHFIRSFDIPFIQHLTSSLQLNPSLL